MSNCTLSAPIFWTSSPPRCSMSVRNWALYSAASLLRWMFCWATICALSNAPLVFIWLCILRRSFSMCLVSFSRASSRPRDVTSCESMASPVLARLDTSAFSSASCALPEDAEDAALASSFADDCTAPSSSTSVKTPAAWCLYASTPCTICSASWLISWRVLSFSDFWRLHFPAILLNSSFVASSSAVSGKASSALMACKKRHLTSTSSVLNLRLVISCLMRLASLSLYIGACFTATSCILSKRSTL
mmetsp:Transcript_18344/g.30815  ORF Transcript_18344/g.30815 Transcript_18344/m.30815 type:complete len:247 (-) Transcript_18344:230-970(-)